MTLFGAAVLIAAVVYFIAIPRFFPSDTFPLASNMNILVILIGAFGLVMIVFFRDIRKGTWTMDSRRKALL